MVEEEIITLTDVFLNAEKIVKIIINAGKLRDVKGGKIFIPR